MVFSLPLFSKRKPLEDHLQASLLPYFLIGKKELSAEDANEEYSCFLRILHTVASSFYFQDNAPDVPFTGHQKIEYWLRGDDFSLVYTAQPILPQSHSTSFYSGYINIFQKRPLDLRRAGSFLNVMLDHSLLIWEARPNSDFQITHDRGRERLAVGKSLLEQLQVFPQEAAEACLDSEALYWGRVEIRW
ncbi:hypothetical protein J4210_00770 [Candidatus Woesearchaeota archaeon]|nr:hypothetical protein [Candidatus Woesearchaeota archaeon]